MTTTTTRSTAFDALADFSLQRACGSYSGLDNPRGEHLTVTMYWASNGHTCRLFAVVEYHRPGKPTEIDYQLLTEAETTHVRRLGCGLTEHHGSANDPHMFYAEAWHDMIS